MPLTSAAIAGTYDPDGAIGDAVLAGRAVAVQETPPVGCLIRFDRKRSRR